MHLFAELEEDGNSVAILLMMIEDNKENVKEWDNKNIRYEKGSA